ncbi:MAG: O-antigen ligase family protein [Planctomycetota bacterium]
MSKVGLFCDKVIEACWLLALIIAPLFFNYHSNTVFDPDKSALIRSIAIVMLMAFIIRKAESGSKNTKWLNWISAVTILLFASYLFSSIVGVSFHTSWWGSYSRGQGTYTLLGYFAIFIITLVSLKSTDQTSRIITTIILTSIPILFYGFAQKLKLDPLTWDTDFSRRIGSTLGNPIFLGSYLIMVIPITLAALICDFGRPIRAKHIILSVLLILQLLSLWMTQSRGPFLGLMAGLFFFITLSAVIYGRKWIIYTAYAGASLLIGFLLLLNIPNSPLSGIKPMFGRFGQIFESKEPAARVRLLIWEGVTNMVKSDTGRALIGYGPENMFIPYHKYTPPELVRSEHKIAFPDRAHNELFDTLITNGIIGAILYLLLFGGVIFRFFKYLNLVTTKPLSVPLDGTGLPKAIVLITLLALGGISGIIIPYLFQGSFIYSSIGVPIGLVMGSIIYLFISLLRSVSPYRINCVPTPAKGGINSASGRKTDILPYPLPVSRYSYLIAIAIFSAIIGHFIETQFGIDLTASRTYFWILLAVLITATRECEASPRDIKQESAEPPVRACKEQQTYLSPVSCLLVLGLLILSIFAFDLFFFQYLVETSGQITRAIMLLGLSWLSLAAAWYFITGIKLSSTITAAIAAAVVTVIFGFILFSFLPPLSSPIDTITFFGAWLLAGIIALAWAILGQPSEPEKSSKTVIVKSSSIGIAVISIIAGLLFIFYTNIDPIRGNILYKIGASNEKSKQWDTVLYHYQEAVKHSMDNSYYFASIARVYMEKYYTERDTKKRAEFLFECNKYLLKSIEYEKLSPTRNANIGRFYRVWAKSAATPAERDERYRESHKYYQIACELSPHNPSLMNEWGETYYEQRDLAKAIEKYQASAKIDPEFSETFSHLGDIYLDKQDINKAVEYYYQAGLVHKSGWEIMREPNQELLFERTNQMLIKYKPNDYLGYYNMMNFYRLKGKPKEASEMAAKVRQLAPDVPIPEITK